MDFGQAISALRSGAMIQRLGWNGKGMFLFDADIMEFGASSNIMRKIDPLIRERQNLHEKAVFGRTIVMKTADNMLVFGWLASQTDIVAMDWQIVE